MRRPEGIQKGFVRADTVLNQYQFFLIFWGVQGNKVLDRSLFMAFSLRKYLLVFLFQFLGRCLDDLAAAVFRGCAPDGPEHITPQVGQRLFASTGFFGQMVWQTAT